ncbi:MAG: glycosyltransferase family 9 protein [Vicinamibacterales bacterium]
MRILAVRLRQIGDVVFTTPTLGALRSHFQDAFISYLVEPAAAPVVQGHPAIDELIVAPRGRGLAGLRAEWALIRRLRARKFDLVLDFHGGPRASVLTWLSGAPRRIGYEVVGRAWMYTTRVPRARDLRPRHSVENQWDLLHALGIPPPDPTRHPVTMAAPADTAGVVGARLAAAGVDQSARLIVIHVSAGNPFRRWPIPAFAEVAARLAADDGAHRVLVTAGPSERDAAARVIETARSHLPPDQMGRVLACGEFSLDELRALVDRAALFIGGDSGPMHIAATSRVPVVGLYGPTLPARSRPWRDPTWPAEAVEVADLPCRPCEQRVCVPGDFRCLTWIRPDHVIDAARRALGETGRLSR